MSEAEAFSFRTVPLSLAELDLLEKRLTNLRVRELALRGDDGARWEGYVVLEDGSPAGAEPVFAALRADPAIEADTVVPGRGL